jgi:hypothetical protein
VDNPDWLSGWHCFPSPRHFQQSPAHPWPSQTKPVASSDFFIYFVHGTLELWQGLLQPRDFFVSLKSSEPHKLKSSDRAKQCN